MAIDQSVNNIFGNSYKDIYPDFIPTKGHYDLHSIIDQNGRLIQTLNIKSIDSQEDLTNLNEIRQSLKNAILGLPESEKFAFWITTAHFQYDLNKDSEYESFFAENLHNIWNKKNKWDARHINNIYLSIVCSSSADLKKGKESFFSTLAIKNIISKEEKFLEESSAKLTSYTDKLIDLLKNFDIKRLSIVEQNGQIFSENIEFFRFLLLQKKIEDKNLDLLSSDYSNILAEEAKYKVGGNKIEFSSHHHKHFTSILHLKETHKINDEQIDLFLQLKANFIITEIVYFIPTKELLNNTKYDKYILNISNDQELSDIKRLGDINPNSTKACSRQVFCALNADTKEDLEMSVETVSRSLSSMGIVHYLEDINLENHFWAQIPGNFTFLRKSENVLSDEICNFASLHNAISGEKKGKWGNHSTIFSSLNKTPYFVSLGGEGFASNLCIFGANRSGKTTLLNFLIAESNKFSPSLLYFTDDIHSSLFIKSIEGKWFQRDKEIVNPFYYSDDTLETKEYFFEFLKIITDHYYNPLEQEDLKFLKSLSYKIPSFSISQRSLSYIVDEIITKDPQGAEVGKRLADYSKSGKYYRLFETNEPIDFSRNRIKAFNLSMFDQVTYESTHTLEEQKDKEKFKSAMNERRNIKAGIIFALTHIFSKQGAGPKILALDNVTRLFHIKTFSHLINDLSVKMEAHNGAVVSTVNLDRLSVLFSEEHNKIWLDNIGTSFILPSEIGVPGIDKMLHLSEEEIARLNKLSIIERTFLIKQQDRSIEVEFNLLNLISIAKILSCTNAELKNYIDTVTKLKTDDILEWLPELYEKLTTG